MNIDNGHAMVKVEIPGSGTVVIKYLVLDYNGTIACDGELLPEVGKDISKLSSFLEIHVVTADTYGNARNKLSDLPVIFHHIGDEDQAEEKKGYVERLGRANVAAIGNGKNDCLMLKEAALGIAVMQEEGCCAMAVPAADLLCRNIGDAFALFFKPKRIIAGLRS